MREPLTVSSENIQEVIDSMLEKLRNTPSFENPKYTYEYLKILNWPDEAIKIAYPELIPTPPLDT